jgi:hypothetical protein
MVGFSQAAINNTSSLKMIPGVCRGVSVISAKFFCPGRTEKMNIEHPTSNGEKGDTEMVVQGFMGCKYVKNDTVCQIISYHLN